MSARFAKNFWVRMALVSMLTLASVTGAVFTTAEPAAAVDFGWVYVGNYDGYTTYCNQTAFGGINYSNCMQQDWETTWVPWGNMCTQNWTRTGSIYGFWNHWTRGVRDCQTLYYYW